MNLPNKLTLCRVILIPFFVYFQLSDMNNAKWIALVIFCIASITDFFDGYLARKNNLVTNFGKFMDPLADKLLVCSALICFSYQQRLGKWYTWVVIAIVAREFIISGFRLIAAEQGIVIAASYWGKFKTTFQMLMIILLIIDLPVLEMVTLVVTIIATALTVISLVDYLMKNKEVISKGGF